MKNTILLAKIKILKKKVFINIPITKVNQYII